MGEEFWDDGAGRDGYGACDLRFVGSWDLGKLVCFGSDCCV